MIPLLLFLVAALLTVVPSRGGEALDELLANVHPDVLKWASVIEITGTAEQPEFTWHHYRNSRDAVDFWPASTIKIYTVVAALEYVNELGLPTDSTLTFSRQDAEQGWILDCARGLREMIGEVFRRSSNEDYTLLLRFVGIDRINTRFLIPAKGFPHSALMRDYVTHRPVVYENSEPQRITLTTSEGARRVIEHTWSGVSYAEQRGATVLSSTTGNCTSTRELAECLRRILFHERLPASERYGLTPAQIRFVREGGNGFVGLRNRSAGPYAWTDAAEIVFPDAAFYHKGGLISNYVLDVAYVEDRETGVRLILALAANSGDGRVIGDMARVICEAVREGGIGTPLPGWPDGFVDLAIAVPEIQLDLRYAGTNNFVGVRFDGYRSPRCPLTQEAADALRATQEALRDFGLGLRVFDAYRPQRAVDHMMRWVDAPDDTWSQARYYPQVPKSELLARGYVAARSSHSRGSTVDLTLVDLASGESLDMGTEFDFFDPASGTAYAELAPAQRAHRMLLKAVMEGHGWRNYPPEWWHFTLRDEPFPDTCFDFPIQ